MHRFWKRYTKPIFELVQPRRVLEIGAEFGWNTQPVLEYCRRTGAHLDVIDPAPPQALMNIVGEYPESHHFHRAKAHEVVPSLEPHDLVLLDGDHNWYSVYRELTLIHAASEKAKVPPPIVLAHDCAWPYARRDMYYAPTSIPEEERHPYAYRGVVPGNPLLTDDGINGGFANALEEGGPKNGVLTALEDFVAASAAQIDFRHLPFHNGLGILIPGARMTPQLRALVDSFFTAESLMEALKALEEDGMRVRVELWQTRERLTRRTQALERARALLAEKP